MCYEIIEHSDVWHKIVEARYLTVMGQVLALKKKSINVLYI